jgi:hypothetical protein
LVSMVSRMPSVNRNEKARIGCDIEIDYCAPHFLPTSDSDV